MNRTGLRYVGTGIVTRMRATTVAFGEDKAPRLAAAIAYNTIFSIVPLFIVLIAVVGSVLTYSGQAGGRSNAEAALLGEIGRSAGPAAATTVEQLIETAFNKPRANLLAQIFGWIFFAFGASGLFVSLQDALNAVWHVESTQGGWRYLVRTRVLSFGMVVVVGFLMIVTFVADAALAFLTTHLLDRIPFANNPVALSVIGQAINLFVIATVFAMLFKIMPDVTLKWCDVAQGAAVTAVFFVIGEALISLYIAYGGVESAYGAAGSILVALVWIYYSALILLFGAEFTKVSAHSAALLVTSKIRVNTEHPAGTDPRTAGRS